MTPAAIVILRNLTVLANIRITGIARLILNSGWSSIEGIADRRDIIDCGIINGSKRWFIRELFLQGSLPPNVNYGKDKDLKKKDLKIQMIGLTSITQKREFVASFFHSFLKS